MSRTIVRTNNQVTLVGRAVKVTEFGKDVAAITVALDNGKDREGADIKDTFVEVKCFEPKVYGNVKPGMLIMVTAHFRNNSYEKDGQKVYALDVVTDSIDFLESKAVVEAREDAAKAKAEAEAKAAKKASRKSSKKAA